MLNYFKGPILFICFFGLVQLPAGIPEFSVPAGAVKHPRVVSINLCSDELLLRVADPQQILAVTHYPKSPEATRVIDQTPGIKKISGSAEEVLSLAPDLVLAGPFMRKETIRFLRKRGVLVILVDVPKSFEDIYRNIETVARAVGQTEKGQTVVEKMKESLPPSGQDEPGLPRALFLQSEGIVPGSHTFEDAIIRASGAKNLAADIGIREYGRLSLERLVVERPDILIFTSDQKDRESIRGNILSHPAVRKAVPHVKTAILPSCLLNCGSPASPEAVQLLVKRLEEA